MLSKEIKLGDTFLSANHLADTFAQFDSRDAIGLLLSDVLFIFGSTGADIQHTLFYINKYNENSPITFQTPLKKFKTTLGVILDGMAVNIF